MAGILVFHTLIAALHAGFCVCAKTPSGYTVRRRANNRWELAEVVLA